MYLRIKRGSRLNFTPDYIVSAASGIGAPMIQDPSDFQMKLIPISGGKFEDFESKLRQFGIEDPWFAEDKDVVALLDGLQKCSNLYILSTTVEVIIASDSLDSRHQFQQFRLMEERLAPTAELLRCHFADCLSELIATIS